MHYFLAIRNQLCLTGGIKISNYLTLLGCITFKYMYYLLLHNQAFIHINYLINHLHACSNQ